MLTIRATRPRSERQVESQRAVGFVRELCERIRRAGFDEAIVFSVTLIAIAGHDLEDRDALDAVRRVRPEVWARTMRRRGTTLAERREIAALIQACRRRGRALSEPPAQPGRKLGTRRRLPLAVLVAVLERLGADDETSGREARRPRQ